MNPCILIKPLSIAVRNIFSLTSTRWDLLEGLIIFFAVLAIVQNSNLPISGQETPKLKLYIESGHVDWVDNIIFSQDGSYFATSGLDNQIKLWETRSGIELGSFIRLSKGVERKGLDDDPNTFEFVEKIALIENRRMLVSIELVETSSREKGSQIEGYYLHKYDLKSGKEIGLKIRLPIKGRQDCIEFSKDGLKVGARKYKTITTWFNTESGASVASALTIPCKEDHNNLEFEAKMQRNIRDVKNIMGFSSDTWEPVTTAFSPDHKYFIAAFWYGAHSPGTEASVIKIWDLINHREVHSIFGIAKIKSELDVNYQKGILAFGEYAGIAGIFNLFQSERRNFPTEKVIDEDSSPSESVEDNQLVDQNKNAEDNENGNANYDENIIGKLSGVRVSPDGLTVGVSSWYSKIYLWKLSDDSVVSIGTSENVAEFRFSPDGKYISYNDGTKFIDIKTKKEIRLKKPIPKWAKQKTSLFRPLGRSFVAKLDNEQVSIFKRDQKTFVGSISFLDNDEWVFSTAEGRFDTNRSLHVSKGVHWTVNGEISVALPVEIFMRDYYEPRLLPRLLRGEKPPPIPSLAELNRNQPKIEEIKVLPHTGEADLVDVKVKVSSLAGQCLRETVKVPCESGVYDLRLYRDDQIVGQSPASGGEPDRVSGEASRAEFVRQWRAQAVVKTVGDQPVSVKNSPREVTFKNIRLPSRADVSQVKFTAYAFNEDRVKSATSEPVVYKLPEPRPANIQRRAYVVTVGVNLTDAPNWHLLFAPNGAREIGKLLKEQLKSNYEVVPIELISEPVAGGENRFQATKSNIQTVLDILARKEVSRERRNEIPGQDKLRPATPDDLVLVYIASHGYADPKGMFYIVPSDIGTEGEDVDEGLLNRCLTTNEQSEGCSAAKTFLANSISSEELSEWLQTIDAGEMTLILDSCHSASVSGPNFKPGPMGDRGFGQLSYDKGMRVLAATQTDKPAWGTLVLNDSSLLTYVLTRPEAIGKQFDMKFWLKEAERRVPEIYDREVPNERQQLQEPLLFDFVRNIVISKFNNELSKRNLLARKSTSEEHKNENSRAFNSVGSHICLSWSAKDLCGRLR